MNQRQMELQKDLEEIRTQIRETDTRKNELLNRESSLKKELETIHTMEQPMMVATNLWCKISNAIIAKYKSMSEENPQEAVKQLTRMEGALLSGGFLTDEDLERAL